MVYNKNIDNENIKNYKKVKVYEKENSSGIWNLCSASSRSY